MKIRHRHTRTITHSELAALLAEHGQISLPAAKRLMHALVACISVALQYGHTVKIVNLGTFRPIARRPYKALGGLVAGGEGYSIRFVPSGSVLKGIKQGIRSTRAREKFRNPPVADAPKTVQNGQGAIDSMPR